MKFTKEHQRLREDRERSSHWKRWGPYLSERQWGTVREDYSPDGSCWDYLSHDHARKRVYRWGEDGLFGITDRKCRLCFSFAFWNHKDPFLKERLFGLTGPQGNHGEDVKELYYYSRALPSYAFFEGRYLYPQTAYPYQKLAEESWKRGVEGDEYEIEDTGVFDHSAYFDCTATFAKAGPNDILIQLRVVNRGNRRAKLSVLPTLWFRNTWSWGRHGEAYAPEPELFLMGEGHVIGDQDTLDRFDFFVDPTNPSTTPLFTNNQTNFEDLFHQANPTPFCKDAFHRTIVDGESGLVNPKQKGTKVGFWSEIQLQGGEERIFRYRLSQQAETVSQPFGEVTDRLFREREDEWREYYEQIVPDGVSEQEFEIAAQAYSGLLWNKQFYYYSVREWDEGDPTQPPPDPARVGHRNRDWRHLYNMDVISVPDKWEYPWYAAWDLAFHAVAFARVDPDFAKEQLVLLLREWYMHPNGQIPAYEFAFSDVNPPVHAWACWRVYQMTGSEGQRDVDFLARTFQKLLINFTWWVNQKDLNGNNLFTGGFLGLDNIGVFDRSGPAPFNGVLEQSDATAWMAFYCGTMLSMALELAREDPSYSDIASKFFEHFISIAEAMNRFSGSGLWDEQDGFYYDQLCFGGTCYLLRIRSLVGLIPSLAVELLDDKIVNILPDFKQRMEWLLEHNSHLAAYITPMAHSGGEGDGMSLLALPSKERLTRLLEYVLDENEFLSPFGIRSLSKYHAENPYIFDIQEEKEQEAEEPEFGEELEEEEADEPKTEQLKVDYTPGTSTSHMFGGNSNWRGPVWFPTNFLLIEALEKYHTFYGDSFTVELPKGSGKQVTLKEASREVCRRLVSLFVADEEGKRPCQGPIPHPVHLADENRSSILFHEYFHGDNGRGLGASHQTGWTALVALCLEKLKDE